MIERILLSRRGEQDQTLKASENIYIIESQKRTISFSIE